MVPGRFRRAARPREAGGTLGGCSAGTGSLTGCGGRRAGAGNRGRLPTPSSPFVVVGPGGSRPGEREAGGLGLREGNRGWSVSPPAAHTAEQPPGEGGEGRVVIPCVCTGGKRGKKKVKFCFFLSPPSSALRAELRCAGVVEKV